MAIVKMQRLHLLAMEEERQSLMDALLQFGRLEIRQTEDLAADPDWAVLLHPEPAELVRWREASRQRTDRTGCPPPPHQPESVSG